jgi:hypothetical protein
VEFRITAQRGDLLSMSCSGTAELDVILKGLDMSIRDTSCPDAEKIAQVLKLHTEGPVSVGWAAGRGWIHVGRFSG